MNQQDWDKVNKIVDTAMDLGKERQNYIEEQCGEDEELKSKVLELLNSMDQATREGFLDDPNSYLEHIAADLSNTGQYSSSLIGETIGNYKILKLIGHGGMGSVFLAERADHAYENTVAFKIIRRGMDTPSNISRFKQERNILASLNHPNIAGLLDGGVTKSGLPFLIMEYVDGTPFLTYCDNNKLSIAERLSLFNDIYSAVQHAHENAIIHRDLKASNILVSDEGEVKIMDFGIAKLLEPDNPQQSVLQTQTGTRILTLGYAAPEQIEGGPITTATDSYTLGVLLYKLLSGVHPFNFKDKKLYEIEATILNNQPLLPSEKFRSLPDKDQQKIARNRNTDPVSLLKQLKGDLDAMAIKALRKETPSRYTSVEQMREDLKRYHQSRPLIAKSDTVKYRVRKYIDRNRNLVAGVAFVILLLISFTSYHFNRIRAERNIAESEAKKAQTVQNVLINMFRSSNPLSSDFKGKDLSAEELLLNGKNSIGEDLKAQPDAYTDILMAIGDAFSGIDAFSKAEDSYQKALAIVDKTTSPKTNKTKLYIKLGNLKVNSAKVEEAHTYALKAQKLLEELENPDPTLKASILSLRGNEISIRDDYKRGVSFYERSDSIYIASGVEKSYEYIHMLTWYGRALIYLHDFEKAELTLQKSNRLHREMFSNLTMTIAENYKYMAWANRELGKFKRSNTFFLKSIELKKKLIGENHFRTALSAYHLARNYTLSGDFKKSEEVAQKVFDTYSTQLPSTSNYILLAKNYLAIAKFKQGKYNEAERMFKEILAERAAKQGKEHISIANTGSQLAVVYRKTGRYDKAISLLKKCIRINTRELGENSRGVGVDMIKLAASYRDKGNLEEAKTYFQQSRSILTEEIPEKKHYRWAEFNMEYAQLHKKSEHPQKAKEYYSKAYEIYLDIFGPKSKRTREAKSHLNTIS